AVTGDCVLVNPSLTGLHARHPSPIRRIYQCFSGFALMGVTPASVAARSCPPPCAVFLISDPLVRN
ncbi:MAG: hypothetical protein ACE5FV_13745, partial [Woeseia sp.]